MPSNDTATLLEQLRETRAAMTQGTWTARETMLMSMAHTFINYNDEDRGKIRVDEHLSDDPQGTLSQANAAGIVATHNVADALIDVAEAAREDHRWSIANPFHNEFGTCGFCAKLDRLTESLKGDAS